MTLSVTLDVGPAVHQSAGLSRYTDRLIEYLAHEPQLSLTLFHNSHSGNTAPRKFSSIEQRSLPMGQLQWRLSALASQLLRLPNLEPGILPGGARSDSHKVGTRAKASLVYHATEHLLPRLSVPTVLTVHDLIFERYPQHHTLRNRLFLKVAMPTFVRGTDAIIAVSNHSKRDLMELYGTPGEKIHVIHEGVDSRFHPVDAAQVGKIQARYSPERPYLLMVGTLEPRKNHATALRAMVRLIEAGLPHQLLIVGGKGWLFEPIQEQVESLGLSERVTFAGFVPDEDLPGLYSAAAAVLVPSLYEGFGFSVLEAMACGSPVIASNVSSLPEVAGDAALLLHNPEDDQELFALIQRLLEEPGLSTNLVERGKAQASAFTWGETARKTAELYRAVADK